MPTQKTLADRLGNDFVDLEQWTTATLVACIRARAEMGEQDALAIVDALDAGGGSTEATPGS